MRAFPTLFTTLLDLVLPPPADTRIVREASIEHLRAHYAPRPVNEATVLLSFRVPLVRALIHEAKFRGNPRAVTLLAELLAQHFGTTVPAENAAQCPVLIPIPLSPKRLRERGYNQVTRVAHEAARHAQNIILREDLLARTRHTPPQTSLTRAERHHNLSGAFTAKSGDLPLHTRLILLDDVATTTATLRAGVAALNAAGFTHIEALALAH